MPLARLHNAAAALARAPFLARLDADDIALPTRLEAQYHAMVDNPRLGLLGGAAEVVDAEGRALGLVRCIVGDAELRLALREACPFVHSALMMRTDLFRAVGGYRTGLNLCEDYDLCARMIERCEAANLPLPLVRYRVHGRSLMTRQSRRIAVSAFCVAAAGLARARHVPEPFCNGRVKLRDAQRLAGLSRRQVRRLLRSRSLRMMLSRRWLLLPLPAVVKAQVRALAIGLGGRGLYIGLLGVASLLAAWLDRADRTPPCGMPVR
jgi:hypothetical protein